VSEDSSSSRRWLPALLFSAGSLVFLVSVVLNATQAGLKLVAYIMTGSLAVYAEMLHSVSDTINSLVLLIATLLVNKRPSLKYPLGFERFPYVASIITISVLVGFIANNVLIRANQALAEDGFVGGDVFLGGVLVMVGVVIDVLVLGMVLRVRGGWGGSGSRIKPMTTALIIEDLFSLSGNIVAITSLALTGMYPYMDAIGSIVIAIIIVIAAAYVIYRNIEVLIGTSAPKDIMLRIIKIVTRHREIIDVEDLRSYVITPDHIQIVVTLGVNPRKNAEELDKLKEKIVREIMALDTRIKRVVIEFTSEPYDDKDREKILREINRMEE